MSLLDAVAASETVVEEDKEPESDEGQSSGIGSREERLKIWDLDFGAPIPPSKLKPGSHWIFKFMDPATPVPNTMEPPKDFKTELVSEGVRWIGRQCLGY